MEKPSKRIKELAQKVHNEGIDPGITRGRPTMADYVAAIIRYLDEQPINKD